jgi:predicted hydrocarbon binding protein
MESELERFQKVSYFLAALAHGAESNLGKGTNSICSMAGKKFGREAVAGVAITDDPVKALEILNKALTDRGIFWEIEPFQGEKAELVEKHGDTRKMRLVFRSCMVRNALFCYAHEQKLSLCHMAHGVFAGAMEKVMPGSSVDLEIVQACPNACLKEMIWTVTP